MENQRGFTVIEMMVVVAIVGIVLMIAVPNFQVWLTNQNLREDTVQIEGNLQLARMAAINRSAPVTVRFNAPAPNQFTVFVDDGNGGGTARNLTRDGAEILILQGALNPDIVFSLVDFGGQPGVLFNGRGFRGLPNGGNSFVNIQNTQGKTMMIAVTLVGDVNVTTL